LKKFIAKITILFVILTLLLGCNTLRKVPKGKHLLVKNEFVIDQKTSNDEEVQNLAYQKPNSTLLKYRFRLFLYNLALQNPDSVYQSKFIKDPQKYIRKAKWLSKKQVNRLGKSFWYYGIHTFLKKNGEPQVLFDENRAQKTLLRINSYYNHKGFFDTKSDYKSDTVSDNKIKVKYNISLGKPYIIDTIKTKIQSPALDSIYKKTNTTTFLKKEQYNVKNLDAERSRITTVFRNNGVFHFQQNNVNYSIDTVGTKKKINLALIINDRDIKTEDSTRTVPFKIYKIKKINIYTDGTASKKSQFKIESTSYKDFDIYSTGKLKYKPKAITNAVFMTKGSLFSDERTTLTNQYLSNLKVFNYPSIQYVVDKKDTINNSLIANIYLSQRKKYNFKVSFDLTRSNIQQFGITGNGTSTIRNVFNGAENFELGGRINLGSSSSLANPNNLFFNILEYGIDSKLIFPKILLPINIDKIISKRMIPSTTLSIGVSKQTNIGLDKQSFTATMAYNWTPRKNTTARFDLFNIQFIKNVNVDNYFNIYKSSYNGLNAIATLPTIKPFVNPNFYNPEGNLIIKSGTEGFANDVLSNNVSSINAIDYKTVSSIEERRIRLTENDLIFTSGFSYSKTNKINNEDHNYYSFKYKLESAGNLLSLISKKPLDANGNETLNDFFGVNYSQYLKGEFEFIKHWRIRGKQIFAIRAFSGLAKPYGNSKSIPFSRSYFAGGSNDNRAWQPYSLGPGSSGALNDFNEANFKLSLNSELRFNIFNNTNGALFVDAGNIWNVGNNVDEEASNLIHFKSLENIAVGSGFGIRQDFSFFVVRIDMGFRTYDPAITDNKKWFRDYNFAHSVFNFGINYPF
jgi:outer membrane protein assembly factor BamA